MRVSALRLLVSLVGCAAIEISTSDELIWYCASTSAAGGTATLTLPEGATLALDHIKLNVTNGATISIESTGAGATIDAGLTTRIFDVIGGTLNLYKIHLARGRGELFQSGFSQARAAGCVFVNGAGAFSISHGSIYGCLVGSPEDKMAAPLCASQRDTAPCTIVRADPRRLRLLARS